MTSGILLPLALVYYCSSSLLLQGLAAVGSWRLCTLTFPAMQHARANMQTSRMPTLPIAMGGIPPAGSHWYSGALTDRPSRGAELRALGRPRRERQPLHEPRNRDSAFEGMNAHEYRAPGSPRNPYRKVEMFYINANVRGPREVRLIARQELAARQQEPLTIAATFPLDQQQLTPALSNATLAALTPRGALARSSQPPKLVAAQDQGVYWLL